jgi:homoserine dehydrogenase
LSLNSFHVSGTSPTPCRIGIVGFGTVGAAVARRLACDDNHLLLTHICDRRAPLKQTQWSERYGATGTNWTVRFDDLLASDVDVIVETIGGVEPAGQWIRAALAAGKSVVTANKQVVASEGPSLLALAARQGRQLRFEAAVGGAMPIVRAIGDGLSGDCITRIVAILNGTTNAVLSQMETARCSLQHALADARSCGYAEADPSMDLDGLDARAKLAILCVQAFRLRVDPDAIQTRSIRSITPGDIEKARDAGESIRQLAYAAYERRSRTLTAWVAPATVPCDSLFARTAGPRNAAVISGEFCGDIEIAGAGAGGDATAVAVLSDLLAIARDRAAIVPAPALSIPQSIRGLTEIGNVAFGMWNSHSNSCVPVISGPVQIPESEFQILPEAV